jgi:hypothetical protein
MFGFASTKTPPRKKANIDNVLALHNANLAAERKAPSRSDTPPPALEKKAGFGKRRG